MAAGKGTETYKPGMGLDGRGQVQVEALQEIMVVMLNGIET